VRGRKGTGASVVDERARGPELSGGYGGVAAWGGLTLEQGGTSLIGDERRGKEEGFAVKAPMTN
jgi:hypothetical protein